MAHLVADAKALVTAFVTCHYPRNNNDSFSTAHSIASIISIWFVTWLRSTAAVILLV
jgi:hypothetical protein